MEQHADDNACEGHAHEGECDGLAQEACEADVVTVTTDNHYGTQ